MDYIVHWGHKESDTTDQLSLHFIHFNVRGIHFVMKVAMATTHIEYKMLEIHLLNLLCSSGMCHRIQAREAHTQTWKRGQLPSDNGTCCSVTVKGS